MTKRYYEWGLVFLRVVLGIIFLAHGLQKVTAIDGIIKFFGAIGLPAAFAYVVAFIETVGGVCLILGLFTRAAAAGIGLVLLGAIFKVKLGKGLLGGYELDLSLLAMSVALVLSGSNTLSLGNLLRSLTAGSSAKKTA